MTYAVAADLTNRIDAADLLQLADRDNSGDLDSALLTDALERADAQIDAILCVALTVPITDVPPHLIEIAVDITIYKLFVAEPPTLFADRYKEAVKFLGQVADGKRKLGEDSGGDTPERVSAITLNSADSDDRVFTMTNLLTFGS